MNKMKKALACLALVTASLTAISAAPAYARGGGGSSGGGHVSSGGSSSHSSGGSSSGSSSSHSSSSGSSSSGSSSSGRPVQAPSNTGGGVSKPPASPSSGSSSSSSGSRTVTAPTGTGGTVSSPGRASSATTQGKVSSVGASTRASGSTYNVPGSNDTYHYSSGTYHQYTTVYHGGYPNQYTSSAMYWRLMNDPFYFPNYANPLSVWYLHPYPIGYHVANGELIGAHNGGHPVLWFLFILFVLICVAVGVYLLWTLIFGRIEKHEENEDDEEPGPFGDRMRD